MANSTEHKAYLGLGSNIEPRLQYLQRAIHALRASGGEVRVSNIVESAAWGYRDERSYLNAVCEYRTTLEPQELLDFTDAIAYSLGRRKQPMEGYAARTMDIDVLLYDDWVVDRAGLEIPHPRLHLRNFVLGPLAELAPDLLHPTLGRSISALYADSKDRTPIRAFES